MSHIHIPDGVLPLWLVLLGWMATAAILSLCIRRVRNVQLARKFPLLGVISALMIVGMTLEIVPIAYHINMSVIAGIVLGPALGFISVFIVDLIIAMFGHGGITVVGLNVLVVGAEAVLGFYLFRAFLRVLNRIWGTPDPVEDPRGGVSGNHGVWGSYQEEEYSGNLNTRFSPGLAAALAAIFSLIISTFLMIGVVYISEINPERVLHVERGDSEVKVHTGEKTSSLETDGNYKNIDIGRFAKVVLFLGMFGWILEAVITGLVINYVYRIRPNLIFEGIT